MSEHTLFSIANCDDCRTLRVGYAARIEFIAREVGFGDAERMRRSFLRLYGQSPQAVRRIARSYSRKTA